MSRTKWRLRRAFRAEPLMRCTPAARFRILNNDRPQGVRAPRGTITR